ncbi:MAG: hypothetical protein GY705_31805 [Bacteroidetes bacterium]|nr:hypothetical protein [Bacteroidota bacterium]
MKFNTLNNSERKHDLTISADFKNKEIADRFGGDLEGAIRDHIAKKEHDNELHEIDSQKEEVDPWTLADLEREEKALIEYEEKYHSKPNKFPEHYMSLEDVEKQQMAELEQGTEIKPEDLFLDPPSYDKVEEGLKIQEAWQIYSDNLMSKPDEQIDIDINEAIEQLDNYLLDNQDDPIG